jgi:spore maturation protein B
MVEIFRSAINIISALAIPIFIVVFLGWGLIKKVKVYEVFVEGAKDGFNTAVRIIPFLVAMLFAIGIFRVSGAMDVVVLILSPITNLIGMPAEVLPLGLLRPLSGSGSMGLMTELMKTNGVDSFIGVLASTMYGSSETTFYILAVYFGSVGIKNTRHALPAGLIADFFGMIGAVFITRILFGI